MEEMLQKGARWQEAAAVLEEGGREVHFYGLNPSSAAYVVSQLARSLRRPLILVTPDGDTAANFLKDLEFFGSGADLTSGGWSRLREFPAHDLVAFQSLERDAEVSAARLAAAYLVLKTREIFILVAPAAALRQKLPPQDRLVEACQYLVAGEDIDRQAFLNKLQMGGYERRPLVEERGEFSVRGGIIDLFPPLYEQPVRLEFWGDTLESLRFFDPSSQRSQKALEELVILPVSEVYLDEAARKRALMGRRRRQDPHFWQKIQEGLHFPGIERHLAEFYPETQTLWDYLPPETLVVEWDPLNLDQALKNLEQETAKEPSGWLDDRPWSTSRGALATVFCHLLPLGEVAARRSFFFQVRKNDGLAQELSREGGEDHRLIPPLTRRLLAWQDLGLHVVLVCRNRHRAERLRELLQEEGLTAELNFSPEWEAPRRVEVTVGEISGGFRFLAGGLIILTEDEALGYRPEGRRRRDIRPPQHLTSLEDLQPGDFVVHVDHGIGIYRGLVKLEAAGAVNDFLELEYQGGDRLFLPVDRLHLVQKYLGVEGVSPKVDKLGGKSWERTKGRVKKAVEKIARELVELYAARRVLPGQAFSPPDSVYREFEASFPYEETRDQLQAIQDVLDDLREPKPMDRLICGDVGYGKTEVALRAAFKVAMDGFQVAFLVPTTILAEQHFETFRKRLAPYPLEVQVLSRFKPPAVQKRIISGLAQGKVDIVIGTHRLLSRDVVFRNLGLVIIDEEQRFGVRQKEKLKEWRRTVDVLTLTATPIPRTLQLSLTGLRELSLINTPPENRRAVRTYICRPEKAVLQAAIRRELARGGQVFFVHNRIQNLDTWRRYVQSLVPEARVAMAHGQMPERELEGVMLRFWRGEVDVLVCTAIIEAGLDIPAANTLIVNRAHTMGLAQLYQLRGRVGRGNVQAYAYLLVPEESVLSREAQKRLKALMEFTELGSGFKIALHDLQIRGAGNLLGQAQSGHLAEVGCELYLQLLEEAIREFKGEAPEEVVPDPEIRIPLKAYLPEDYVPDIQQRLALYRRLSGRLTPAMVEELAAELQDRFGPLPPEGQELLQVVRTKERLRQLGIKRLEVRNGYAILEFAQPERLDLPKLLALLQKRPEKYRLSPDQTLRLSLPEEGAPWARLEICLKEVETFVKGEKEG
jgi:transcription-repair coupling factor (superfamily II helicase)